MPISELGYRHWTGKRTGRFSRAMSIARSEVAIAYKSSKLLRRFVIFAWLPILYFCPFFLAVGYAADPANSLAEGGILSEIASEFFPPEFLRAMREQPELSLPAIWAVAFYVFFAYTQSLFSMVVVAIAGPPLISKDLRSKAFLVYFSKPIQPWQYLLGKLATVMFFVFSMTLFPGLLLYAFGVGLSPDASTLVATLPILLKVAAASAVIAVPVGLVVLLLSSLTKDRKIATFLWVALWVFGEVAFRILTLGGNFSDSVKAPRWPAFLSLREQTTRATSGVFQVRSNIELLVTQAGDSSDRLERNLDDFFNMADAGYPPLASAIFLTLLSAGCGYMILRRAKGQVKI